MNIIAIDLEPTPYKYDLWNFLSNSSDLAHIVYFIQSKNWSHDAGHSYDDFPPVNFNKLTLHDRNFLNSFSFILKILITIIKNKRALIFICGYSHFFTFLSIFLCSIVGRKFVLFADSFNINDPRGIFYKFKKIIRYSLRFFIFKKSKAVLVCGKHGIETSVIAGCPKNKVIDFPYVIDIERIKNDLSLVIPSSCIEDIRKGKIILFFSGRMIERKGLKTLLQAISLLKNNYEWHLWIEGDGIDIENYKSLAFELGVNVNSTFLGFCQYRLHSWLLLNSNIVIIPSLDDNWGIVVDEALQLGKVVISTDKTGSAIDRISHGMNGLIFPAGDYVELSKCLEMTLNNKNFREQLQQNALNKTKFIKPQDNVRTLINLVYE